MTASATAACRTPTAWCSSTPPCMHGPKKRAGGVACLEGVRTPSLVAKAVLEHTDHHLLVGKDAQRSRAAWDSRSRTTSIREHSRKLWLDWKRRIDPQHYLDPEEARRCGRRCCGCRWSAEGLLDPEHLYGTINCNGVNAKGEICGVTTTSGLCLENSGARGRFADPRRRPLCRWRVGAAGSTGRGEANLYTSAPS